MAGGSDSLQGRIMAGLSRAGFIQGMSAKNRSAVRGMRAAALGGQADITKFMPVAPPRARNRYAMLKPVAGSRKAREDQGGRSFGGPWIARIGANRRREQDGMTNQLEQIDSSTSAKDMAVVLRRDGAAIVTNALSTQQLASINHELDVAIAGTAPGLRNPTEDFFVEFYGKQTIRIDGLPAKSRTFWTILEVFVHDPHRRRTPAA